MRGRWCRAVASRWFAVACAIALMLACVIAPAVPQEAAWAEGAGESSDAAAQPTRVVRVAFPQQENVAWTDDAGRRSGYLYEYLERMAQHTGWEYEFVPIEGDAASAFDAACSMLANGEVDLIGGMYAAEGVDDRFLLSNDSYAMLEVELQVPVEQVVNPVSAAEASGTLRVAVTDGSRLIEDAQRYCDARHIDLQPVTCVDRDDQLQAVRDGRADAVLATSMGSSKGVRSAARLAARPVCFATSAGDEALMAELNGAMTSISCGDPQFWTELYAKYFSSSAGELVLTDDERAYVEHAAPIRVGVLRDQAPYQYEEDGELKGVAVDLLAVVAEKTGLTFEYVGVDSNADLAEKQAQGLIDLQACAAFDYDAAREAGVSLTQPYVRASYVLVMNEHVGESDLAGKRLALSATSTYNGMFVGDVHRFDSVADCLRAVVDGRADYTYLDEYVVQYYLNTPDFDNLKLAPQTHDPRQMSFGVVKGADGRLLSILDKTIGSFAETETQAVINGNVLHNVDFSIADYVRVHPLEAFGAIAFFVAIVLVLVLGLLYQRSRSQAKSALDLKKRMRLYALTDDYFYEYDCRTKKLVVTSPAHAETPMETAAYDLSVPSSCDEEGRRRCVFMEAACSGEPKETELHIRTARGGTHWVRISAEPVSDEASRRTFVIGRIELIDDERREKDLLLKKAERDSLTQVLNAEATQARVKERLAALQAGRRGCLMVVDVDRFKEVNDTFGHLEGDAVLRDVARLLQEASGEEAVVGRPGGDEFMVYREMSSDDAALEDACEALRRAVRNHAFSVSSPITLSVGAALSCGDEPFEELYRRADEALYVAKREGRDRFHIA